MANLSIKNIPDETHMALKVMAAEKKTNMTALIVKAIGMLFERESQVPVSSRMVRKGVKG